MANQFASEAALASLLKFAPQREALRDLGQEAEQNFGQAVRAGVSAGRLGVQAVGQAIPEVRGIYNRAQTNAANSRGLTNQVLAQGSAPRDQGYRDASAMLNQRAEEQLQQERASALRNLQAERVAAATGPLFTANAAREQLARELTKIGQKQNQIGLSQGSYAAEEANKLARENRKEEGAEARSLRTLAGEEERSKRTAASSEEGHDVTERGQNLTNARALAKQNGPKPQSPAGEAKGAEAVQTMLHRLSVLPGKWRQESKRGALISLLSTEVPSESATQSPSGQKTAKVPGFPVGPQMNAAIDQWIYGYVNPVHQEHLKQQGYNVKALGLTRYEERPHPQPGPYGGVGGFAQA